MNTHRFLSIFALALLMVFSTGQVGFGAPWDLEELTVSPGFGDVWNRYTYTQVYYEGDSDDDSDDAVYFGTYNQRTPVSGVSYDTEPECTSEVPDAICYDEGSTPPIPYGSGIPGSNVSKGGRIYKYHVSTEQWSLVWPNVDNLSDFDPDDFGMRIAEVYDGKIYFGTYHTGFSGGAHLLVIDPADDSVVVIEPGPPLTPDEVNLWNSMTSIRAMAVFNGKLYLGSEFPGKLWSYDGAELALVWERPGWIFSAFNVAELEVYSGYLYMGGWFSSALYRMNAAETVESVDIGAAAAEEGVISLEVFQGKLFVGTSDRNASISGNPADGFSLFYFATPEATPTFITTIGRPNPGDGPGQGNNENGYAWIMKECGDLLFMGVFTQAGGVDEGLWATSDGDNWMNLTEFFDPTPTEYGGRSLACGVAADGIERLYHGTAANFTSPSTPHFTEATRIFRIEGPFDALPPLPPE